jgi:hypothetical protein
MFHLSCDPAMSDNTMLMTLNTKSFLAEAASAASALPCWHTVEQDRRPGYVPALAGRYAR